MHAFHRFQVTLDTAPIKNPAGIYHPAATSPAVILDGITNTQAQVVPSILPLKVSTYKFIRKSGLFTQKIFSFGLLSCFALFYMCDTCSLWMFWPLPYQWSAAFSFQPLRSFTMDSAQYQQEILLVIIKWKKQKNIYQALVPVEDKSSSCHEVSPWSAHKADTQWLSPVPVTSQSSHTHPLFTEQTLYISICFQNFTDPLQQNWPE